MSQISSQFTRPVYSHSGNNGTLGWLTTGMVAICATLMLALGIGPGLLITVGLLLILGYGLLCWYHPAVAIGLIVCISAFSEVEKRNYDPISQIEYSLQASLQTTFRGPPVMPLEMMMLAVAVVWFVRRSRGDIPKVPIFGAYSKIVWLLVAGLVWGYVWGVFLRGGGDAIVGLWEARAVAHLLVVTFLAGQLIRTEDGWRRLAQALMVVTGIVALKIILRSALYIGRIEGIDESSFDHNNVLFFNFFFIFGLAYLFFKPKVRWSGIWWAIYFTLLPFIIIADVLVQRRSGFGSLGLALVTLLVLGARWKPKTMIMVALATVIFVSGYFAAFWNTSSPILAQPIRAVKSLVEPDIRDFLSNQYREIEYFNLMETLNSSPVLGIGFGQEFLFVKAMPNISGWPFWRYTPHNEVVWLWLKLGLFGFIVFWLVMLTSAYRGIKLFWTRNTSMSLGPLFLAAICANVMQVFFAWIDQGYSQTRSMLWLAPLLALVCYWQITEKGKQVQK